MSGRFRAHLRRVLRATSDVTNKIPTKDDSVFSTVVKSISLLDSLYDFAYGKDDAALEYLSQFNLISNKNSQFVSIFFSSLIRDYKLEKISVDDEQCIVKVTVPENGTLFFIEETFGSRMKYDTFYHTLNFNFKQLLENVWDDYNGKIHVSISSDYWDRSKGASFSKLPMPKDKVYGESKKRLKKMIRKDIQYRIDNIPRCFLFVGDPGTGKSTFALHMAKHSNRVLKLNATGLSNISVENINFLLNGLEPEYLIIDDIDRIMLSSSLATLLSILDIIKETNPDTMLILTANHPEDLSRALKRPGRIDEIEEFLPPSKKDRKEIFSGYTQVFKVKLSDSQIETILDSTEGLTAAYIKEVAIQAKYLSFEDLLDYLNKVKKYALDKEDEPDELGKKKKKSKKKKKKK